MPGDIAYMLDRAAMLLGALVSLCGLIYAAYRAVMPWLAAMRKHGEITSSANIQKLADALEHVRAKAHLNMRMRGDAVYICRPDGANVWVSDALADMFDMSTEAMRGNGWAAPIVYEDRMREIQHWRECVATDSPYHAKYTIEINDQRRMIETEAWPHRSESGEILFWIGYCRDRGQVLVEQQREQSEGAG